MGTAQKELSISVHEAQCTVERHAAFLQYQHEAWKLRSDRR